MARPRKLTLDFFLHDAKARADRKIRAIRRKYGNDGYATYFCLLEMLCNEEGLKLSLTNQLDVETAIDECGLRDEAHLYKIIETCTEIGLFDSQLWHSERVVFSRGLFDRFLSRLEERRKDADRKQRKRDAEVLQKRIEELDPKIRDQRSDSDEETDSEASRQFRPENPGVRPENPGQCDEMSYSSSRTGSERVTEEEGLKAASSKFTPANPPAEKVEGSQEDGHCSPPKILSSSQKNDLQFHRFDWGFVKTPDPEFLDYLVKVDLPASGAYRDRAINKRTAQTWVLGILDNDFAKAQKREIQVQQAWEAFQEWKSEKSVPVNHALREFKASDQEQVEYCDPKEGLKRMKEAMKGMKANGL